MADNPYPSRRDRAAMRGDRYQGGDTLFLKRRRTGLEAEEAGWPTPP